MYYADSHVLDFDAKCLTVFNNVLQKNKRNLVILDKSLFYPTSGGQMNDIGVLTIAYTLKSESLSTNVFVFEERNLINELSDRLSKFIENKKSMRKSEE